MGIDGDYIIASFSKEEDAKKLVELHEEAEEQSEYDFVMYREITVDKYDINNYYIDIEEWEDMDGTIIVNKSVEYRESDVNE